MVCGLGTDIIEISRIKDAVKRNPRFLTRYFSKTENEYFRAREFSTQTISGMFAAKEAVIKAIGYGRMIDIEISHESSGKPTVSICGDTLDKIKDLNQLYFHLSISHCKQYAVATVILEVNEVR